MQNTRTYQKIQPWFIWQGETALPQSDAMKAVKF
jgi:hypothetical protein